MLNNAEITSTVAPAIICYSAYECGSDDMKTATKDVNTENAGFNITLAEDSYNIIKGSHVAKIYKPGTEDKLHKYDAAFYSKMSMNMNGGEVGDGVLNINAENEGLDSELHLPMNGGQINIVSGNDGINTNEDNVSVTTVNDGTVKIRVDGATGEGDGIDSNGWLVINGGTVISEGCSFSMDAGIDSDMGIHINGGTVIATGNMLDHISESTQNYAVFTFADKLESGETVTLKDAEGNEVVSYAPENSFTYLIFSDEAMTDGTYTLWAGDTQLSGAEGEGMGGFPCMPGGFQPDNFGPNNMPEGFNPDNFKPENMPGSMTPPAGGQGPQGGGRPGGRGDRENRGQVTDVEVSKDFAISAGGSYFSSVGAAE